MLASSWFSFQIAMCPVKSVYDFSDPCITPIHFTNCCQGVYGQLPFPNVSDFFRSLPRNHQLLWCGQRNGVFQQGKGSLLAQVHVCACVCARQGRAAPSLQGELRVTHLLTLGNLHFVVPCSPFKTRKAKRHTSPSSFWNLSLVESKLRDGELHWESQLKHSRC